LPRSKSKTQGIPLGEILIEQGILTRKQVDHLLNVQRSCHRPIGDLAERLYGVSPKAVEDAWVEQYLRTVGVVDLNDVTIDVDCLRLLNRRQAWQFHVLARRFDRRAAQRRDRRREPRPGRQLLHP
jgi:hypothetical protein